MSNELTTVSNTNTEHPAENDYVTMTIADQLFGVPVLQVRDVLGPQRLTRIPLAPPEVAGSLNLRGRIVTAIDVRTRLSLQPRNDGKKSMCVVVDLGGELYSLVVDGVGEVMRLAKEGFEANPPTLDPHWRGVSKGIYRLKDQLLVLLDVVELMKISNSRAA
jgi:purine-binding chemotaxis protein CheW